jgi:hypothetical protein
MIWAREFFFNVFSLDCDCGELLLLDGMETNQQGKPNDAEVNILTIFILPGHHCGHQPFNDQHMAN